VPHGASPEEPGAPARSALRSITGGQLGGGQGAREDPLPDLLGHPLDLTAGGQEGFDETSAAHFIRRDPASRSQ